MSLSAPTAPPDHLSRWLTASRWMLFATAAGLWLYVVRWHYGPLPTTLLETLIVITVALYVVGAWRAGRRRPVATPLDIPIVLLLIAGAISVGVAADHRGALGLYRAYFIEPIALFYVGADLLRRTVDFRRLLIALAVGSSVFAIFNVIVFARALIHHAVNVGAAPNAFYMDANYVAMYFDPMVALATGVILYADTVRWRWFGVGWFAIAFCALMIMFSKGSYLGLAALGIMAVASLPRWRVALLASLVAAAVLISRIPLVAQRLSTASGSIFGREEIFLATLRMIRDHPILGVGLGGYSYRFRNFFPEVYPHDIWLTFWVELGLLGVLAFAFILFALIWRGLRALPRTHGFDRAVVWGITGALIVWTVHGFVDSPYWKNDMSALFWIMAALELAAVGALARGSVGPARTSP